VPKKSNKKTAKTLKITKNPLKKAGVSKKVLNPIKTCLSCPYFARVKKPILVVLIVILLVLAGLVYLFKGQFVVALVDGKPIWRWTLIKELEKQGGSQVLDTLITETLILQEAKDQNVEISLDEINQEMGKIEESLSQQGQKLDEALKSRGMTKDNLIEEIRVQKIIEKLAGKDVEVSDEELDKYIEENKESLSKDVFGEEVKIEDIREDIKEELRQQKINEGLSSWLDSLHEKAKVKYFLKF